MRGWCCPAAMRREQTAAKTVVLDELLAADDAWQIHVPTLLSEELLQLAGVDEAQVRYSRCVVTRYFYWLRRHASMLVPSMVISGSTHVQPVNPALGPSMT